MQVCALVSDVAHRRLSAAFGVGQSVVRFQSVTHAVTELGRASTGTRFVIDPTLTNAHELDQLMCAIARSAVSVVVYTDVARVDARRIMIVAKRADTEVIFHGCGDEPAALRTLLQRNAGPTSVACRAGYESPRALADQTRAHVGLTFQQPVHELPQEEFIRRLIESVCSGALAA